VGTAALPALPPPLALPSCANAAVSPAAATLPVQDLRLSRRPPALPLSRLPLPPLSSCRRRRSAAADGCYRYRACALTHIPQRRRCRCLAAGAAGRYQYRASALPATNQVTGSCRRCRSAAVASLPAAAAATGTAPPPYQLVTNTAGGVRCRGCPAGGGRHRNRPSIDTGPLPCRRRTRWWPAG